MWCGLFQIHSKKHLWADIMDSIYITVIIRNILPIEPKQKVCNYISELQRPNTNVIFQQILCCEEN